MNENTRMEMRPIIAFEVNPGDSKQQIFQNATLRPILKMQHDHFMVIAHKYMPSLILINEEIERRKSCQQFLNKNPLVMHLLLGMVIGIFNENEMAFYLEHTSDIHKRIKEMLIGRIADGYDGNETKETVVYEV